MMKASLLHLGFALLVGLLSPALGRSQDEEQQTRDAKFQATYVWQQKPGFKAAYSGPNSLSPNREKSYSFTATAFLGLRLWQDTEVYFNPEVAFGVPLSKLTGLGGYTNGEIARVSGPQPTLYRARLFVRQTWGMGGGTEQVESEANQLARTVDKNRLVLTAGNISVMDIFDDNAYSHDPRTQFLNWTLMTHGAYDFAADARGYSWGAALEYIRAGWAMRAGRFMQPKEPNQLPLDPRMLRHYGDQFELERSHDIAGQPGKLRFLVFRNVARMARYQDALDLAARTGTTPDLNAVRAGEQRKQGLGLNLEQALSGNAGLFGRASWADGQTETYAFTEADRSLSAGVVLNGTAWGRTADKIGVAAVRNGLSNAHRSYLGAGGLGFFIGDGRINYRPETIVEAFFNWSALKGTWVSLDLQHIDNPAYNGDRGPVNVGTMRLHLEF